VISGDDVKTRLPLSKERIVEQAVAIADADGSAGVSKLSMRALARELGYEVMSLYNHVANKDELLAAMVDAVGAEIARPDPDAEPLAAIRAIAIDTHDTLVRHKWSAELWVRAPLGPARTARMEDLLRLFAESGLGPEIAHHGFHAVTNHVVGYTLQQLGMAYTGSGPDTRAQDFLAELSEDTEPHTIAHIHEHLDGNTGSSFELVLDLILDGLVRLDETRR